MYHHKVVADDPHGVWPMDTNFQDISGRANHGAFSTSPETTSSFTYGAGYARSVTSANALYFPVVSTNYQAGREGQDFTLEAWVNVNGTTQQSILSHINEYDGLVFSGTQIWFSTKHADGTEKRAAWTIDRRRLFHVVGIHTKDFNELWINGERKVRLEVDSSGYKAFTNPTRFYAGQSAGSQAIVIDTPAVYNRALSDEEIVEHYEFGRVEEFQDSVAGGLGGTIFNFTDGEARVAFAETLANGVNTSTTEFDGEILPQRDDAGLTVAGNWVKTLNLHTTDFPTFAGLKMTWDQIGAVTVETSLDGTNFTTARNGYPLVSVGFVPLDKVLTVRVTFPAGATEGSVSNIVVTAYEFLTMVGSPSERTVTFFGPAALSDSDSSPTIQDQRSGVKFGTAGRLTIGPDISEDPVVVRTLEMWVDPGTDNYTLLSHSGVTRVVSVSAGTWSTSGVTTYVNGIAAPMSAAKPGMFNHVVFVYSSDFSGTDIFINSNTSGTSTGSPRIHSIALYPTALTALQIQENYNEFYGGSVGVLPSSDTVSIAESVPPAALYEHDWAIVSG